MGKRDKQAPSASPAAQASGANKKIKAAPPPPPPPPSSSSSSPGDSPWNVTPAEENAALKQALAATKKELEDTKKAFEDTKKELDEMKSRQEEPPSDLDDDDDDDDESVSGKSDTWSMNYCHLRAYAKKHGDCKVPQRYQASPKLGSWVNNQRTAYRKLVAGQKSSMTQERIGLLDRIGFYWGNAFPPPKSWEERFQELEEYKEAMGTCNVPVGGSDIGRWVALQRSEFKRLKRGKESLLSMDQVKQLNGIGFKWKGTGPK